MILTPHDRPEGGSERLSSLPGSLGRVRRSGLRGALRRPERNEMSFDEFKGWLRGWLENLQDMDIPTATARILEELEKVEDVEAAPVVPYWPVYPIYPQPQGPVWVEPYITWTSGDSTTGDGLKFPPGVWTDETVRRFNEYKAN